MEQLIKKIKEQIAQIKNEILLITDQIELTRAEVDDGDIGVVTDFQDKLDLLSNKIENLQKNLSIYQSSTGSNIVDIGNTVEFSIGNIKKTVTIVLPEDVDTQSSLISIESPIGQALYQKKKGDSVEVQLPGGKAKYVVNNVK